MFQAAGAGAPPVAFQFLQSTKLIANLYITTFPISQDARKREIKAAQRRTGGGGVLGMQANSDSDGEDGFLDAAQLRVADALKKRLDKDLELQAITDSGDVSSSEISGPSADGHNLSDSDGGGVSLFKNAPRVKKAINRAALGTDPAFKKPVSRGADISSDEEERIAMCVAAAVDGQDLVRAAEKAAEKARVNIVPVDPGSEDEGGKAKQRKRRREQAEKAAAAAGAAEEKANAASPAEDPNEKKTKQKKENKEKKLKKAKKEK